MFTIKRDLKNTVFYPRKEELCLNNSAHTVMKNVYTLAAAKPPNTPTPKWAKG